VAPACVLADCCADAVLLAAWFFWSKNQANQAAPVFVTTPLARGNLTLSVMANGTLQPTRSVSIGSELSGTVSRVLVDVNDKVKKGRCWWSLILPS
jgi:HlyD family secretion protein